MKTRFLMALGLTLLSEQATALQVYKLIDQRKTQALISKEHHTRIAVEEDRIQQIFGAEGIFDIQTDDDQGQLFLKPMDKSISKPTSITIITEAGLTQDLRLMPRDLEAQSILFRSAPPESESEPPSKSIKAEIAELMEQMMRHQSIEGYQKHPLKRSDRSLGKLIGLNPVLSYQGQSYVGRVYKLTNKSEYPLTLTEKRIFRSGDVAISISKETVAPKETAWAYIISKSGELS